MAAWTSATLGPSWAHSKRKGSGCNRGRARVWPLASGRYRSRSANHQCQWSWWQQSPWVPGCTTQALFVWPQAGPGQPHLDWAPGQGGCWTQGNA